jgi:hypothetical protein
MKSPLDHLHLRFLPVHYEVLAHISMVEHLLNALSGNIFNYDSVYDKQFHVSITKIKIVVSSFRCVCFQMKIVVRTFRCAKKMEYFGSNVPLTLIIKKT